MHVHVELHVHVLPSIVTLDNKKIRKSVVFDALIMPCLYCGVIGVVIACHHLYWYYTDTGRGDTGAPVVTEKKTGVRQAAVGVPGTGKPRSLHLHEMNALTPKHHLNPTHPPLPYSATQFLLTLTLMMHTQSNCTKFDCV